MLTIEDLPHLNAILNTITFLLLVIGFTLIKLGYKNFHRIVMLCAITVSAIFLVSYLIYHFTSPVFVFPGTGWTIPAYYLLLVSHVILAMIVTPMVVVVAWFALKGVFEKHKKFARWVWPMWLYVTGSGVAVYIILYHIYPTNF
ncbi:MAG: hypothetical protein CBC47_08135 [Alphaproteobacteria bacterium TMED87]|nr:hypothetical protein [Rhodospirillaceae bacterium]OUV08081.1 MAG: hypothetical protein CBC47_08135 [Alphaproteobacteria bacterium TMED87]